jgi:hypothetical protein
MSDAARHERNVILPVKYGRFAVFGGPPVSCRRRVPDLFKPPTLSPSAATARCPNQLGGGIGFVYELHAGRLRISATAPSSARFW